MAQNESNNNSYKVVSSLEKGDEAGESLLVEQNEDKIKVTPKTTLNPKEVRAMKNVKALNNEYVKEFVEKMLRKKLQK